MLGENVCYNRIHSEVTFQGRLEKVLLGDK